MRADRLFALLLATAISGCGKPVPATAPVEIAEQVQDATLDVVESGQEPIAETALPVIAEVRDLIAAAAPPPTATGCVVHPDAVALIVRFEITSEAYYRARLLAPVVPPLQSGVTIGVGDDLRFSTQTRIGRDWGEHAQVERLLPAAGLSGDPARALVRTMRDVRTEYELAYRVFRDTVLPRYCRLAERTFHDGWVLLTDHARGALVATVYVRGAGMMGDTRAEMRVLRDTCVPAGDVDCVVQQFLAMPRVWRGKPGENGLRARFEATAELAGKA